MLRPKSFLTVQYRSHHLQIRRLIIRSREDSKARDLYFELSHRFEIWRAPRKQCCRGVCQDSERSDNSTQTSQHLYFARFRDKTSYRILKGPQIILLAVNPLRSWLMVWSRDKSDCKLDYHICMISILNMENDKSSPDFFPMIHEACLSISSTTVPAYCTLQYDISYHIISYHITSYHIISNHIISYIISYHIIIYKCSRLSK